MPFDIEDFLRRVEPDVIDVFLKRHGNGHPVDWQRDRTTIARDVVAALSENHWAARALENCEMIASSGGRDLLLTAGDHQTSLSAGVEDLERNDETCAVWLATEDPDVFEHVVSAAHALKGLGTRSWDAFKVAGREPVHALVNEKGRMERFRIAVEHVLRQRHRGVPLLRSIKVSHFEYSLERVASHSLRPLVQVNVYGDTSPKNHEFLMGGELTSLQLPGLYRAALVFDYSRQVLDVVTLGGRPVRDALVQAFQATLLPDNAQLDHLVHRAINFGLFRSSRLLKFAAGDACWRI